MSRFLEALRSGRALLMDGAMGTELQKAGLRDDENGTAWNLLHPERVRAVHQAYRDAGAEVCLTNTFMANAANLDDAFPDPICRDEFWRAGRDLIAPTGARVFRLTSIGPVAGRPTAREFDQLCYLFAQSSTMYDGADGIVLETCSSPRAAYAIQRVRKDAGKRPILLSLTYRHDRGGKIVTFSGHAPEWFARRARQYGLAALGVNCGRDIGMDDVIEIVLRYRAMTDLPLFARLNAGTPTRKGRRWVYPLTPKRMAARLPELLDAGASMVGGCCGTTPAHTAACRPVLDAWNARNEPRR
jgi:5-methyltetrahydrofolate--homocysteine methyltransferase